MVGDCERSEVGDCEARSAVATPRTPATLYRGIAASPEAPRNVPLFWILRALGVAIPRYRSPLKSRPPPFEKGGPRGDLGTQSLSEIPLNPPFPKGEASLSREIAASPEAPRNVHTFSRLAMSPHSGYCEPLAWQSHGTGAL